jgi:putative peptidoglycan lipid II flippase
MSFFRSLSTVTGLTLLSRVLGYARDVLIGSTFGDSGISDAFFVALRLPNVFRRLFAEGALNSSFVPIFTEIYEQDGKDQALRFVALVFSTLTLILLALVGIFEVGMPSIMGVIAIGFKSDMEKFRLAVDFGYLTFPYIFFIALASLCAGVLNSLNRFFAATAAPIILNLFAILAVVFYGTHVIEAGYALSLSISLAGVVQFLWVFRACWRAKVPVRLTRIHMTPKLKLLLKRMLPGIAGGGVYQFNLLVSDMIASFVPMAISYLSYADRINQFPLSLIGIAMGTVLLPVFSRQIQGKRHLDAMYMQNRALQFSFVLTLPASMALATISLPIIMTLFEHNKFTHEMSINVAHILSILAFALPANVIVKILSASFFATGDTRTPVKAAIASMASNVVFNLLFFQVLSYLGIALASTLASWLNALLLFYWLRQKKSLQFDERLKKTFPLLCLCAIGMGLFLWEASSTLTPYFHGHLGRAVISLILLISGGLAVYLLLLKITKAFTYKEFLETMHRAQKDSEVVHI